MDISTALPIWYEFDHIGIAVKSLEEGEKLYRAMGWAVGHEETVESEKVRVKMFELGNNCRIELLEPTSDDSTVAKFLKKRGPGIHHICLRVKNISACLRNLKEKGFRLVNETPIEGARNCRVGFIHPSSAGGVLIEVSEEHPAPA